MTLFPVSSNNNFDVDYDRDKGMYRVTVFNEGHYWDECWFEAYAGAGEIKWIYIVYGQRDDCGNIEEWVEAVFDNKEQADACEEYLNITNKQSELTYFVGNCAFPVNEFNYIEKVKKLKGNK